MEQSYEISVMINGEETKRYTSLTKDEAAEVYRRTLKRGLYPLLRKGEDTFTIAGSFKELETDWGLDFEHDDWIKGLYNKTIFE